MNAIIMAAGTSSRFVPLSYERPKGLLVVKGEVLIERQIQQLHDAGIDDITIVVGYKAEMFHYLTSKYGVSLVMNEDYDRYNNTSSIVRVLDRLGNTFICSSDNYFPNNVFIDKPAQGFYSALYATGKTDEYCLQLDESENIVDVTVGGHDAWYMVGHVFFDREFSFCFRDVMQKEYLSEETKKGYWEDVYIRHIFELPKLKVHKYSPHEIEEFDSLEDLRSFDSTYINHTESKVFNRICSLLECEERELVDIHAIKKGVFANEFSFLCTKDNCRYIFDLTANNLV